MRFVRSFAVLMLGLALAGQNAHAQALRFISPKPNELVRGEYTVRFEGLPPGGYAMVKLDGAFLSATGQQVFTLDTIADRTTFTHGDGAYRLSLTAFNSGGKRVGDADVTFNVGNAIVTTEGAGVKLSAWSLYDRLDPNVQRYRVFAESNAIIDTGATESTAAGDNAEGVSYLAAPLDWQISALMRRIVRDVGMYSDDPKNRSANIRTIVQEAFQRQRVSEGGGAGGGAVGADGKVAIGAGSKTSKRKKKKAVKSVPVKGPWNPDWTRAPETGQYFVKMVMPSGSEINATRKATTIAIADLLPTFPETPVRPGSTWETTMTLLGELSDRSPINVRAPITFTSYENLQTPGGESRKCAKLESRFRLPETLAKRIAIGLAEKGGQGQGAAGGGASKNGIAGTSVTAGDQDSGLTEEDIAIARTDVARVLWFDIERSRVLRSEDTLKTYYELASDTEGDEGGDGGGAAAGTQPSKVTYNLGVTTWLDDRIPPPTDRYNNGAGTAHGRDSVTDATLSRVIDKSGPGSTNR